MKYGELNLSLWLKYFTGNLQQQKNLHKRPSTPSSMACGEVGKLPLQVTIDKRLMSFWLRLLIKEESSLAHSVYMIAHNLFARDVYKAKWLCRVKNIVDNCGLRYLWQNQSMMDINKAKQFIHTRIEEVASYNWYTDISTSSMCTMYRFLKKQLHFEDYLLSCNNRDEFH